MELPDTDSLLTLLPDGDVGENLEYDSLYLQMEELALSVPPSEMGDSVSEGKEPDYRALIKNTISLWSKTRDLRVAVYHTLSAFCLNGLSGMKQGLQMIDYLCSELWDRCYPLLDPDDDNDPTERLNILSILSPKPGSYNDPIDFVGRFRKHRILDELSYSLRDVLLAQGIIQTGEDTQKPDPTQMTGDFRALPRSILEKQYGLLSEVRDLLTKIKNTVNEKIGMTASLSFETLEKEIGYLDKFLTSQMPEAGTEDAAEASDSTPAAAGRPAAQPASKAPAEFRDLASVIITSRQDALLMIRKSAEYFKKAEPSSPLPYLLERAIRMSDMNFIEILTEIDKNSLEKAREQLGVPEPTPEY